MKIAVVSSHPTDSLSTNFGDSIRKRYLIDLLEKNGHQVLKIIAGNSHSPPRLSESTLPWKDSIKKWIPGKLWGTLKDVQYRVHDRSLTSRFLKTVLTFRPDLIYDFNFYLHKVSVIWAKKLKVPLIVEISGPELEVRYSDEQSFLQGYGGRFESAKYRQADQIVSASEPLKEFLVQKGIPKSKIQVIPNWVDLDEFNKEKIHGEEVRRKFALENHFVIGFVGVFSPWYSLESLLEAFAELRREFPKLALLLVGDGVLREKLEKLSRDRQIAGQIRITGFIPRHEVPSHIAAMDLAVIPNHQWWCSPLKLLEYGAMGKPVIAPQVPSITSIISQEEALLIPGPSQERLLRAIPQLLQSSSLRRELGENLFQKVKTGYSVPAIEKKFLALLPNRKEP